MVTNEMQQPPLRLTRRGRVAVLGLFIVLASLASAVLFATASRAQESGPTPTVVVQPHDTLWSIAARETPSRDLPRVIAEIRRLNGLADPIIQPGQILQLPR